MEQAGAVKVLDKTGVPLGTYIIEQVNASCPGCGPQGLLGLAFDPNFGRNPLLPGYGDFYLAFTAPSSDPKLGFVADQIVRRYSVNNPASNDASAAASVDVIRIPVFNSNHIGGDIHFGRDGYLYFGMGDGDTGGNPDGSAQCLWKKAADTSPCGTGSGALYYLLGKMMRLDVHQTTPAPTPANMCGSPTGAAVQYAIPGDNPYVAATNQCAEIWLYGFRNPYRWSFDRSTGDQLINDVGQNTYEEVDLRTPGSNDARNYGWNLCESSHFYSASGTGSCPAATATTAPILEYDHTGGRCAIIGGFSYRGPIGDFNGTYAFSDACSDAIYLLHKGSGSSTCPSGFNTIAGGWVCTLFAPSTGPATVNLVSGFGEDEAGNLYVTGVTAQGAVYKFISPDAIFANGFDW